MDKQSVVADFGKIKANIEVMKQGNFNELRYFFEIRKLYSMSQALFAGGGMMVNNEVMGKVPIETLEKHFDILTQIVCQVCDMALELRDITLPQDEAPGEEKSKKTPPEILYQEREISYVI